MLLKFVDLIFPGGTVGIINIPKQPSDYCWKCRNGLGLKMFHVDICNDREDR